MSHGAYLRRLVGPWVPHRPTAKQVAALEHLGKREIFYGGAAGGGKTDWLLTEALRFAHIPGYAALLLRRTYPELSQADGLIPRAHEWLAGTGAEWREGEKRYTFPSGATMQFASMEHEKDRFRFKGGAFQFVGFDELTGFLQTQYRYLFSRLRRLTGARVPIRMRAASNPGDVGHAWVKQRFLVESHPDRVFVPSKLDDNPHLDREQYRDSLEHLHPYDRAQLLDGDWDVKPPGARFKRHWFGTLEAPLENARRVRFWDLAATAPKPGADPDYTVGALVARNMGHGARYAIEDVARIRAEPGEVDRLIRATAERDGLDVQIRLEQEPGASGKFAAKHFRELLAGYDVRSVPSTGSKVVRSNPLASAAFAGDVAIVRGDWNEEALDELESFTGTKADSHDDIVDACSGGYAAVTTSGPTWDDLYPEVSHADAA